MNGNKRSGKEMKKSKNNERKWEEMNKGNAKIKGNWKEQKKIREGKKKNQIS